MGGAICFKMACAQGRSVEADVTLFEGDTEEAATCITQDIALHQSIVFTRSTMPNNVYLVRVYLWARPLVH